MAVASLLSADDDDDMSPALLFSAEDDMWSAKVVAAILCAGRVVRKSWLVSARAKEQQRSIIMLAMVVRGCVCFCSAEIDEREVRSMMIEPAPRCEVW